MDIVEKGFGELDWTDQALDREKWRALVNSVMNLRFHKMLGNYRVAARLVTSQEALSSTQLVTYLSWSGDIYMIIAFFYNVESLMNIHF
jgi:hypothetical protein